MKRHTKFISDEGQLMIATVVVALFTLFVVAPALHHVLFWSYNLLTGKSVAP